MEKMRKRIKNEKQRRVNDWVKKKNRMNKKKEANFRRKE